MDDVTSFDNAMVSVGRNNYGVVAIIPLEAFSGGFTAVLFLLY